MKRRRELASWREARTLDDLGRLTADWLESTLPAHPGYWGVPDEETGPLVPVLAAVNRAGLVTVGSQPGVDEIDDQGVTYRQRAAVELLAQPALAASLVDLVGPTFLSTGVAVRRLGPARRWRCDHSTSVPVTLWGGRPVTDFGAHLSRRVLRRYIFAGCGSEALAEVYAAHQVTLVDLVWGRDDQLWPLLADVAGGADDTELVR
jgi:hypothetical protein